MVGGCSNRSKVRRIVLLLGVLGMISRQAPAQDEPAQQPAPPPQENSQPNQTAPDQTSKEENKDQNANPAHPASQGKKKDVTEEAAEATERLGKKTLFKVRDWESGWLTGPYVGRNRQIVPMTAEQRRRIYLQQTLTTPSAYVKRMLVAAYDQIRDSPPQWGQGWEPYGERFASREGSFLMGDSLAALGNAALKFEPRYDQCRCSGFWPRTRHAVMRNFLTYNQSEQELRPQWALYGGALSAGVISATWKPHPRNALADGGYSVLDQAGLGALLNVFTEFAGDINRKLGLRRKRESP